MLQSYRDVLTKYGALHRVYRAKETVLVEEAVDVQGELTGGIKALLDDSAPSGGGGGGGPPGLGGGPGGYPGRHPGARGPGGRGGGASAGGGIRRPPRRGGRCPRGWAVPPS